MYMYMNEKSCICTCIHCTCAHLTNDLITFSVAELSQGMSWRPENGSPPLTSRYPDRQRGEERGGERRMEGRGEEER